MLCFLLFAWLVWLLYYYYDSAVFPISFLPDKRPKLRHSLESPRQRQGVATDTCLSQEVDQDVFSGGRSSSVFGNMFVLVCGGGSHCFRVLV